MRGFYIVDFHSHGQAKSRPSENLQCKKPSFLTKWWDLLDLSKRKKLLDLVYIHPRGVRESIPLFFFGKVAIVVHPNAHPIVYIPDMEHRVMEHLLAFMYTGQYSSMMGSSSNHNH